MANCYDTPILLDDGIGTAAAPGSYIGFGRDAGTAVSSGPRIHVVTGGSPNGVLTAPIGSLCICMTGPTLVINTDGGTTWGAIP